MSLPLIGIGHEGEVLVLELVTRIERCRALRPEESDLVAELIRREKRRAPSHTHAWTPKEDRELLRVQHRPRGVIIFAERIGVSEKAARRRLEKLVGLRRNKGKCATPPCQIES